MDYDQQALERLCDKIEEVDGCYEYQGAITDNGYGFFWYKARNEYAHRVAWRLEKGEIPESKLVLHLCDNRRCVRVKHLFLGTHKDNTQDMMMKGRCVVVRGSDRSIISDATIKALKEDLKSGMRICDASRKHGIEQPNVSAIARGKSWRHI